MRKLIVAVALLSVLSCRALAESDNERPSVEVIGLQAAYKGFDYDEKWNRYRALPFNMQSPGVEVALALSSPGSGIIKVDKKASTILRFVDNVGTSLLKEPEDARFGNKPGLGPFPKISKDGRRVIFSVRTPHLPAKDARSLSLSGTIALLTGSEKKTAEAEGITLATGTEFTLGAFSFKVGKTGKAEWGNAAFRVELNTDKRLDSVIELLFLGPDGKDLKAKSAGGSSMSMGGIMKVTKGFHFKEPVTTPVTVKMTYWADMKQVTVPFSVKAGLMPIGTK